MNLLDATFLVLAGLLALAAFWLARGARRSSSQIGVAGDGLPAAGGSAFDCGSSDGGGCGGGD